MLGTARYITAQEVRSNSTLQWIDFDDNTIDNLTIKAQDLIDGYLHFVDGVSVYDDTLYPVYESIGSCNECADSGTEATIPLKITRATLLTIEWLRQEGGSDYSPDEGKFKKETTGPHTIEYSDDYLKDISKHGLPSYIIKLLKPFKLSLFKNTL